MDVLVIIQISCFIIFSILITNVSRRSLHNVKHHGFYRFFAFEAVLILIIINIPYWFSSPFSFLHILSWIFLLFSLFVVIPGIYLLMKKGGHKKREMNSANYEFENTVRLVKTGIYKYIRHPLYCSIALVAIGALLKNVSVIGLILAVIVMFFVIATAKIEEIENLKYFGSDYTDYMKNSKMFIPYIY